MNRIKGIDTIRFVCAIIVVIGHIGIPSPDLTGLANPSVERLLKAVIGCLFNGPAAVIAFFVISGFCIHFPFRSGERAMDIAAFYSRRLIRICIPAICAVALCLQFGVELKPPLFGVFWSILCELIYYLIYPALLILRRKFIWNQLIIVSCVLAFCLSITHLDDLRRVGNNYGGLGYMTWVIGLPCWLLGCWLAENYARFPRLSTGMIWLVRTGIFAFSVALRLAKFHVPSVAASNVFTLTAFAFPVCIWIGLEIVYFQSRKPAAVLERLGEWSYSLYIIHPVAPAIFLSMYAVPTSSIWWQPAQIIISLLFSYAFYLAIEKPAHKLAVYVSRQFASPAVKTLS